MANRDVRGDQRLSRPDVTENRRTLEALRYAAIRLMEVGAGILVRIESTETKLRLSRDIWALAQSAEILGRRLPGLRSTTTAATPANSGYVNFTDQLVALRNPEDALAGLVGLGYPNFRDALLAHRVRLYVQADEATQTCLDDVLEKIDALARPADGAAAQAPELREYLDRCGGTAKLADEPSPVPQRRALEEIPLRPGRDRSLREAGAEEETAPSPKSFGVALHEIIFMIEISAAEICSAVIAHHPEAPWGLRYGLARQVRDEGRHFELLAERMRELGTEIGDHPIRFEIWDKFVLGETLAERILIEQRLGEGIGLDGGLNIYRRMKEIGDEKTALIFDYINADEVTHVRNGNQWLGELLDSRAELDELDQRVRRRLAENDMPISHPFPINAEDRRLAGFTEPELQSLHREWAAEQGKK